MKQLVKFSNLTSSERRLLVSALFRLVAIRVGMWVIPLRVLLRRLHKMAVERDRLSESNPLPPERIVWAIRVVSRYLQGTMNCLVQAFATQSMLARRGHPARVRIGVAKDECGQLKAHAWVECEGKIVIGGVGMSQYTALPYLEVQR